MNKKLLFLLFTLFLTNFLYPQNTRSVKVTEILPGIEHKQIINSRDTLLINILSIDLTTGLYDFAAVKAIDSLLGREKTSSMFARYKNENEEPVAAINSDFFRIRDGGEPENNMVSNGVFVKAIGETDSRYDTFNNIHSQFAYTFTNKPLIEKFSFVGRLFIGKDSLKVNRVNSLTDSAGITLYNKYQGEYTPDDSTDVIFEAELNPISSNNDTLMFVVSEVYNSGKNKIDEDKYILSSSYGTDEKLKNEISLGDTIVTVLKFDPETDRIKELTGGWGKIVQDGKNYGALMDSLEGTFPRFSARKHPRSGIGFSKDSSQVFLITVDGRQEISSGATLYEFAEIMLNEGIYQGLNFDGGGSTTMVINGDVVNKPSDKTGERAVGSCLIVVKKRK